MSDEVGQHPAGGVPEFEPRMPEAWMEEFLISLKCNGVVRTACEAAGVSRLRAQRARARHPEFRAAWASAIADALDRLEAMAWERAAGGGRSSDMLLWNMLQARKREMYGTRVEIDVNVQRRVQELAKRWKLDPREVLAEAEGILAGEVDPQLEGLDLDTVVLGP